MGEIRFVGTGETRGYPYLVCKNKVYTVNPLYNDIRYNSKNRQGDSNKYTKRMIHINTV